MSDGGKGSKPRPFSIAQEEYNRRWDMIFGRDLDDETQHTQSTDKNVFAEREERETRNNQETQQANQQAKN